MEVLINLEKRYTYADYLTWVDDKMRELIDGFVKLMSPAPSEKHQHVCGKLTTRFNVLIEKNKGKCKVYPAPFDVRLPKNDEKADDQIYNVVQPDVCVVCDPSKIDKAGCIGAPDLVIEVQSLSTIRYDLTQKFNLYESSGVREYWVVYPFEEGVEVFLLQSNGKYDDGTKYERGKIPVHIFDGCEIELAKIFN